MTSCFTFCMHPLQFLWNFRFFFHKIKNVKTTVIIFEQNIDDLRLRLCTHKYLDDTTISETVEKDTESSMQQAADELIEWSENNRMNINCKKTKEMILGPLSKKSLSPLLIAAKPVQRVTEYKLLGVTVNATLKWDDHVNAITSKSAKRLWFLKKLKRAGVDKQDLVYFFLTVIRPVLEYACSAWHTSLTKQQTTSLENIQRRALQIIAGNIPYDAACCLFKLTTFSERQDSLCSKLFRQCAPVPSVLWHCWFGGRKGIRPVKNRVVGYWHGCLSGLRCRLAYGPADATATHCLLLQ